MVKQCRRSEVNSTLFGVCENCDTDRCNGHLTWTPTTVQPSPAKLATQHAVPAKVPDPAPGPASSSAPGKVAVDSVPDKARGSGEAAGPTTASDQTVTTANSTQELNATTAAAPSLTAQPLQHLAAILVAGAMPLLYAIGK